MSAILDEFGFTSNSITAPKEVSGLLCVLKGVLRLSFQEPGFGVQLVYPHSILT
jgi:hypothetical protein